MEKLYRFVHISERKPTVEAQYCARLICCSGNKYPIEMRLEDGIIKRYDSVISEWYPYDDEDIEWLEELPPQPETAEDEVEAVARAICHAAGENPSGKVAHETPGWRMWQYEAKAAIAAMRLKEGK